MKIGVYSPNWIGDAIMALPFISELKDQNPNAEINVICKEWVSGVYKENPAIDELITIKHNSINNIVGTFKTGWCLKLKNFDQFFTLTDSFRSALILWISGSKNRVGYKAQMRSFLLTKSFHQPKKRIHRTKKFLKMLRAEKDITLDPNIYISEKEKIWAKEEIKKLKFNKPVAVTPFSIAKNRSISNSLIKKWIKNSKNDYLIFGSKNDAVKGDALIKQCQNNSIKSICGRYTLRESISILSECRYSLATDSGLGHISAALGLPTISFFGVGHPEKTSPIGERVCIVKHCNRCKGDDCDSLSSDVKCIKKISKLEIEAYVNNLLKQ